MFRELKEDDSVTAAAITGAGKFYSSGNDLTVFLSEGNLTYES